VWIISLAVARPATEVPNESIFQKLGRLGNPLPATDTARDTANPVNA
jgi:hypothetical protein